MYSAIQIPELRDELARDLEAGHITSFWKAILNAAHGNLAFTVPTFIHRQELENPTQYVVTSDPENRFIPEYAGALSRMLRGSEMYFVNDKMTDLAFDSGAALPTFSLKRDLLPAELGFVIFSHELKPGVREDSGVIGASWFPDSDAVWVQLWERTAWWKNVPDKNAVQVISDHMGRLVPLCISGVGTAEDPMICNSAFRIPYSLVHAEDAWKHWGEYEGIVRALLSCWILMRQQIPSVHPVEWNSKQLKQFRRRDMPPSMVRVVSLRHVSNPVEYESEREEGGRVYNHRWWVQGHWRQQPYPSTGEVRAIWISPYVKGPEDAEFMTGEKVNVLRR